jgi:tRNA dimethylallyltransferase
MPGNVLPLTVPTSAASFFIIAGPTAVGKSALAVAIAERCGGEIVSADAFQVYQGLDLLTAKPSAELRARVPHHLIGEIPLAQSFDVAQFLRLAEARIHEIRQRHRVPIIVGGTGLYLRALTHGLADLPGSDATLRARLETQSDDELCRQLAELDPAGHAQIDRKNRRRVIRALEVCLLTQCPFSSFREQWEKTSVMADGVVLIRDRLELHERINRRTEAMFAAGVEEEIRHTENPGPTASQTLGWMEIRALLDGKMSRRDCIAAIQLATRRYAKRQMTWFRREPHLQPTPLHSETDLTVLAESLAQRALGKP